MVSIEAHCAVSGILEGRRNEAFIAGTRLLVVSVSAPGASLRFSLGAKAPVANCLSDCSTSKGTFLQVTANFYRFRERANSLPFSNCSTGLGITTAGVALYLKRRQRRFAVHNSERHRQLNGDRCRISRGKQRSALS
jgi:hypothetical protein